MTRPAPPPLPVVRFVGSAAVGKKRLVQALLAEQSAERKGSEAKQRGNDDESSSCSAPTTIADADADGSSSLDRDSSPPSPSARFSLWELDTRYYTARLSLERSRIFEAEEEGRLEEEEDEEGGTTAAEAVVLVFDPAREGTFAAAARWWSSRSSSSRSGDEGQGGGDLQQQQPAVKLCVATGGDSDDGARERSEGESGNDPRREAEAWCIDNAFELVDVPFSSSFPPSFSAPSPSASASPSAPEGISRLRDALAAHTWPGLVRKAPSEVEDADGGDGHGGR